ncbi:T6SS effector amidase Tae4 family protein [Bradyrhizobium diazoefficiens]|nr:T6SS effector amidase Tae4 family protein [Bradyrhizobium diazoefficiens]MCD9815522.1 type VI secretion system amidase effector protein Tae4 [Bradyrhizobium diazoefficiens]MCD9833450.1 type VI secretion system amidase effector protein Tae4 [Bradyrhizobium diazoefficiens]MDC8016839.1 T6SS effector amidase Tae4 family protein [Bradyrhizobium diazoefficiens]UFW60485.1 type VI secretion system amidase effector protein Tae4 [Bradyrhizobium diazoefficiens]UQD87980.1 hypothetical protein JEY62_305
MKKPDTSRTTEEILSSFGSSLASIAKEMTAMSKAGDDKFEVRKITLGVTLQVGSGEIEGSFTYRSPALRSLAFERDAMELDLLRATKPSYATLSSNYSCDKHSCSMTIDNSCAVRLSEALINVDKSWIEIFQASGKNLCDNKYVRGAQDLAAILNSKSGFGIYDFGIDDPNGTVPSAVQGKQGIVIYMDIPGFPGQGHIGLWDKTTGHCNEAYWNSKRVWFWELR